MSSEAHVSWLLRYEGGTLLLEGATESDLPPSFLWDARVGLARAPALCYASLIEYCRANSLPLKDEAKAFRKLSDLSMLSTRTPRWYQAEALAAWKAARWRGVVVLPTGAGKTHVAERAIAETRRSTLIVVPTIDLLSQWYGGMKAAFGRDVGLLGGGHFEITDITVSTYDSAANHIDRLGNRFGLIIWDEAHHLPAPYYARTAQSAIAPLRLGLSATPERPDNSHLLLDELIGPICYRREIPELSGHFLAPYRVELLSVGLSPEEQDEYTRHRTTFQDFLKANQLSIKDAEGWKHFLYVSSRSKAGREAFRALRRARQIAHSTERKLELVQDIVADEWGRPTLIFTNDNETAFKISRMLLAPCITHHTDTKERRWVLDAFGRGELNIIVTSRVLNEGVDLPGAEVAIVVSGTSTVRESVQRLGRILRPGKDKEAVLYELIAEGTTETAASARRREHDAYR